MWAKDTDNAAALREASGTGTSPDGQIQARLSGDPTLEVTFRPRAFEWYAERELQGQLGQLLATTWTSWNQRCLEILCRAQGRTLDDARRSDESAGEPERRYADTVRNLECEGHSLGGSVRILTVGMTRWHIEIEPGALHHHTERMFIDEVRSAFAAMLHHRDNRVILLKAELFDLGIPRHWLNQVRNWGIDFRSSGPA